MRPIVCLFFIALFSIINSSIASEILRTHKTEHYAVQIEVLLQNRDVLWGFDFVSPNHVLLTERSGKLLFLDLLSKKNHEITGLPKVAHTGQGGLLDLRSHPNFSQNRQIYLTYAEAVTEKSYTTVLGVGELSADNKKLQNFRALFSAQPANSNSIHFGSRVEFDRKGFLYLSIGDRNDRDKAQELDNHLGKILRLDLNGKVPQDNPFIKNSKAKPEIYSLGHRNPQGLAYHPMRDELWESEFGPKGGDELNWIRAGLNYGWPLVTHGQEYWGPKIGKAKQAPGFENPVLQWTPSISPSAIAFYTGGVFAKWKHHAFLGNLSGTHIRRVELNAEGKEVSQEALLKELGWRFRNLRTGPDGYLYFSTDEGRFGRLIPEKQQQPR